MQVRSVCITGAPGAGKSTVAKAVAARLDLQHYSTGDLARRIAEQNGEAKKALDRGQMAPPALMDEQLLERLKQGGLVLDGYPRYHSQLMDAIGTGTMVVMLNLTREKAVERLRRRGREDYDAMRELARLQIYKEKTHPLGFEIEEAWGLNVAADAPLMDIIRQIEDHWYKTGGQT